MIKSGKMVSLAYCLKNDDGEILDQSSANDPFAYLHGGHQIVPGLEKALDGLKKGDKKAVSVSPAEGYGEINPDLKMEVNRTQFPPNVDLQVGMEFETRTPDGHGIIFTIMDIENDKVKIDANHPLAGENLHFDVEVLDIRDATAEELSPGHSHGGCCCGDKECGDEGCDDDCGDEGCGDSGCGCKGHH